LRFDGFIQKTDTGRPYGSAARFEKLRARDPSIRQREW
jgi:hypothetical protein